MRAVGDKPTGSIWPGFDRSGGISLLTSLNRFIYPFILIVLWSAIFIATINRPALFDGASSYHAEAVREMLRSGDWVTMRIDNGIRYLEKAPLIYWLAAFAVSAFGLHDWTIRLPLAVFSLLLILLIFRFGARLWGGKAGFYSGLVMATCLGHYAFTRRFAPDLILSFFIAFSLYCYARITIEEIEPISIGPIDLWCAALYISAALAVLTKGLIGLIFPGATIFIHILVTGNWKILRRLQIGYGTIIFLIVAAPWHVAAALANSDFMWFYFIREHVLRFLEKRYPRDYGSLSPPAFWCLGLLWLFPWSAFLWGLVKSFPKPVWSREKTEQACLLLFIWIGVVMAFFTLGTAQEYYSFPCLAALALLLGKTLGDLETGRISPKIGIIGIGTMAVLTLSTGFAMIALTLIGGHGQAQTLSATLITNPETFLAIDHLRDLTPATFSYLAPLVYPTAALLIVGPLVALLFAARKRWMVSFLCLSVMMIGLCRMYNAGMVAFEARFGSKNLAEVILHDYRQGDKIVINDFYEKGSTLNYYTGLQVLVLNGSGGVLWYGLQDKSAPRLAITEEELLNQWKSANRIFLFSKEKPLESFIARHPDFSCRVLAEAGGKKILVNW